MFISIVQPADSVVCKFFVLKHGSVLSYFRLQSGLKKTMGNSTMVTLTLYYTHTEKTPKVR